MRRAVSVSLGSSTRNHEVEIDLLGARVHLSRLGTDGDLARAERLIRELDGTVDAFGLGGAALTLATDDAQFPMHSIRRLADAATRTPLVDGTRLKQVLEERTADWLDGALGASIEPRRAFFPVALDRWDMARSFVDAGYECLFGDLAIALALPIPLRSLRTVSRLAALSMPVLGRVPFAWVYPTGPRQDTREPRATGWFSWATVIAGDFHYIRRHMPDRLDGKIVCTNTTTALDVAFLRTAGVRCLVTTTPLVDGRTFGTNLMEAALLAATGAPRPLAVAPLRDLARRAGLVPTLRRLDVP